MRKTLSTFAAAIALTGGLAYGASNTAHADTTPSESKGRATLLDGAHHNVKHLRVTDSQAFHRKLVAVFNDDSTWEFGPCKYEDSRNCWWDADKRGNKAGHTFINLRGQVFFLS